MFAPILIPLAILGGMDGVEPLRASVPLCEKAKRCAALEQVGLTRDEVSTLAEKYGRRQPRRMSYRAASKVLGVDVGHLWRVVHGERVSKRLCARLRAENIQLEVK